MRWHLHSMRSVSYTHLDVYKRQVIISGIILYLPVLSMDISSNIIVQILSAALIVLDDLDVYKRQIYRCGFRHKCSKASAHG